jgi:Protein of unknown function (DUF732)
VSAVVRECQRNRPATRRETAPAVRSQLVDAAGVITILPHLLGSARRGLRAIRDRLAEPFRDQDVGLVTDVVIPGAKQSMADLAIRPGVRRGLCAGAVLAAGVAGALSAAPNGHADAVAYLVNVTVRPGYNFANADAALDYGHTICDNVAAGRGYPQIMGDVKADFSTSDEFQASYLITQAVGELCPAQIWALRNSAAGYRPPTP